MGEERAILWVYAYTVVVATVGSLLLVPTCIRLARRLHILDVPNVRKVHESPTPLLGGLAIAGSFTAVITLHAAAVWWLIQTVDVAAFLPDSIATVLSGALSETRQLQTVAILVGALLVVGVGVLDDIRNVRPAFRLVAQAIAAALVVSAGISPEYLGMPAWLSAIVTVCWIVVITNSFNLIDSLDGLAAGVATICTLVLATVMHFASQPMVAIFALAIAGSSMGFLRYNWCPAKIFMGSSGSLFLGYIIAVAVAMAVFVTPGNSDLIALAMPFLILAVPLYDTLSVIWLRLRSRQGLFTADQRHLAHRLMRFGFSRRQVVWVVYLMTFTAAVNATLLIRATSGESIIIVVQIFAIFALIVTLEWGGSLERHRSSGRDARPMAIHVSALRERQTRLPGREIGGIVSVTTNHKLSIEVDPAFRGTLRSLASGGARVRVHVSDGGDRIEKASAIERLRRAPREAQ